MNPLYLNTIYLTIVLGLFVYFFYLQTKKVNINICLRVFCFFTAILIYFLKSIPLFLEINRENYFCDLFLNIEIFILIIVCICFIVSYNYILNFNISILEYSLLVIIASQAMIWLVYSNNLISCFLFIELQSLCFYILACLKKNSIFSFESGIKYFIYSSIMSILLIFGISLIYITTGLLSFYDLQYFIVEENDLWLYYLGILFLLSGIFFKLAVVPFHFWIADVYEGAPLVVTMFFALLPKISFIIFLFKIYFFFNLHSGGFNVLLQVIGFGSVIYGIIITLYQTKIKRLLAYGTVVHMGYILIAVSINSFEGLLAVYLYLFIYILLSINIFAIMILVKENKRNNFENIVDLVKLWNTNKGLAIIFCLSLASLAGLPPFIGFFGKFYIFSSLIENGNFLAAFILLIFSVLGCVYYVRMIRFVLFTQSKEIILIKKYNYFVIFILVIITLINIFFILFQGPLIFWIQYLILKLF